MSPLIPRAIADFTTQLSSAISVGSTSFTLASILDDDGTSIPDGKYCFTLDNGSSDKEYLMGDNVAGTVSNVKSVSRQGVETTGAARAHRIGASVILTDFAVIQRVADILRGASTLDGSLPLAYDTAPSLSSGLQVATVAYVLSIVTGGTVNFDNQIIAGTAGESLALPNIVYLKESDARWYLSDADVLATFQGLKLGVARGTATVGNAVSIQLSGLATGFSGLTAGTKYYLSNTAGGVSSTAGTNSVFIGWAISTTVILLAFDARGALLGSQGFPSEANPFITADNLSQATTDQTQTTQNGTVEVGEADATTKKNLIAQSFIPAKTKIRGVFVYKSANTGTNVGDVVITLQADTAGSPSGTPLATKTFTATIWNGLAVGEVEALFSAEYASLVVGSLYWIVVDPSTSDNSNHINLGTNTAGGYTNGSLKYKNTTDGWVAIATIDLYFKTLEGNNSQIPKTNPSGYIPADFVDYATLGLDKVPGAFLPLRTKLFYSTQLQFLNSTGAALNATTTDYLNWTVSSTDVLPRQHWASFEGSGADHLFLASTSSKVFPNILGAGSDLNFDNSNIIDLDFWAKVETSAATSATFGFSNDSFDNAYTGVTRQITFVYNNNTLYAKVADGTTANLSEVAGITTTNVWLNFRIIADLGANTASFYVNGKLVATLTTNFPAGTQEINIGFGRAGSMLMSITAPVFSIEMNP